jgi:DNA-directed RNA polymerase subunit K/omega
MTSEVVCYDDVITKYNPEANETTPIITKYEFAKILGQRMEQLARGAPSLIDASKINFGSKVNHEKFREIAENEIKQRVLPFMIQRNLPNGNVEYWRLVDMIIPGY